VDFLGITSANILVEAPVYWCIIKAIEMLAARLPTQKPLPIQSAVAERKWK